MAESNINHKTNKNIAKKAIARTISISVGKDGRMSKTIRCGCKVLHQSTEKCMSGMSKYQIKPTIEA